MAPVKLRKQLTVLGMLMLAATATSFLASTYFLSSTLLQNIDSNFAMSEANRALSLLELKIDELDSLCSDWAEWDDTYEFIVDHNEDYIKSNWVNGTFPTLGINFAIYLDREGRVVFSRGYDLANDSVMEIPSELAQKLPELSAKNDSDVKRGILVLDTRALIFTSRPILRSNESGPFRGTLIFARYVDNDVLAEISQVLERNVTIASPVDSAKTEISGDTITGIVPVKDFRGKPAFSLAVKTDRLAYESAMTVMPLFIAASIGCSSAIIIAYLLYTDRRIARRIVNLSHKLHEIVTRKTLDDRVDVEGSDEISLLGERINDLIKTSRRSLNEVKYLNEDLRLINKILRHDLSNELTALSVAVEALKEDYDEKWFSICKRSLERMTELISNAKQIDQAFRGDVELESIDIAAVIGGLADKYGVKIRLKGTCKVLADENLKTVFENLIRNAVEHGKASEVTIDVKKTDGECEITVTDNGVGIAEDIRERIFEEGITTGLGSGLGLYIAKKLVEKYGGKIELKSTRPATFIIKLKTRNSS